MKKRTLVILAALLVLSGAIVAATTVNAAEEACAPTLCYLSIIPESTKMTVANPFQDVTAATAVFVPQGGKMYVGERIANVRLALTNAGRMSYGTNIVVEPAKPPANGIWPHFDLRTSGKDGVVNQLPVIAPGQRVELTVDVFLAYGSPTTAFQGLVLKIYPAPADTMASEKG